MVRFTWTDWILSVIDPKVQQQALVQPWFEIQPKLSPSLPSSTHFTKCFSVHYWNLVEITFAIILILMIPPCHKLHTPWQLRNPYPPFSAQYSPHEYNLTKLVGWSPSPSNMNKIISYYVPSEINISEWPSLVVILSIRKRLSWERRLA